MPAESGEMGVLANHVPSIEQLKPGLVEVIEEAGGSKQFFCTSEALLLHGRRIRIDVHSIDKLENNSTARDICGGG